MKIVSSFIFNSSLKNQFLKFVFKIGMLGIPIYLSLVLYFILDPFKVIHNYKSYYDSGHPSYADLNRDFVSFETFLQYYPTYKYDSYIFGNSRTFFYQANDWKKLISSKKCFHFDASSESLFGIFLKIKYLENNNIPIKNALIVLDTSILNHTSDSKGILFMKHPKLSGRGDFSFQMEYLKAFYDNNFFWKYLEFRINPNSPEYHVWNYDVQYNELSNHSSENLIKIDIDKYYKERSTVFYKRDTIQKYAPMTIGEKQKEMLRAIYDKLKKDKSDFKIIISPLYDQIKLNRQDLETLQNLFGKENVFDFSGINSITNDCHNYYEKSHYRPHVAAYIMEEVYK